MTIAWWGDMNKTVFKSQMYERRSFGHIKHAEMDRTLDKTDRQTDRQRHWHPRPPVPSHASCDTLTKKES